MEQIACKECTSPYCHGCNMYRLERMLMSGKLDALMDEKRTIKMDADVRPVVRGKWEYNGPDENVPYCSNCMLPSDEETRFCAGCGADMREES